MFLFIKFGLDKKYTVTLDTDGGGQIASIEVKDDEIIKLPEEPTKEGYKFSAWVNEENNVVTTGTKIKEDTTLKALWIKEDAETITLSFDTDGAEEIGEVIIEKGTIVLLPVTPIKKGYIFAGWINEEDNIVNEGMNITENIALKALWIKEDSEIKTVKFDADEGSNIITIIIEKGKGLRLPIKPTKAGYVFKGWIDDKGNSVNSETIITEDITFKAIWVEPYTCPSDCTPSVDGSTCIKVSTKELITGMGCPSGYTLKEGQCLDLVNAYYANNLDVAPWWSCDDSSHIQYDDCYGMGCMRMCAKKANKVTTSTCPSGYTKDGNICKKTETINCTAN